MCDVKEDGEDRSGKRAYRGDYLGRCTGNGIRHEIKCVISSEDVKLTFKLNILFSIL